MTRYGRPSGVGPGGGADADQGRVIEVLDQGRFAEDGVDVAFEAVGPQRLDDDGLRPALRSWQRKVTPKPPAPRMRFGS